MKNPTMKQKLSKALKADQAKATREAKQEKVFVISNIADAIDQAGTLDPMLGYKVMHNFVRSLSYYTLSGLLWAYRKAGRKASFEIASGIDPMNDGSAEQDEAVARAANMEEIGFEQLGTFDAVPFVGVYKKYYRLLSCDPYGTKDPVEPVKSILANVIGGRNDEVLQAAYEEEAKKHQSPIDTALAKRTTEVKARVAAIDAQRQQVEADYVLREMLGIKQCDLSSHLWTTVPLWLQYKWTAGLYNALLTQIAFINATQQYPDASMDNVKALAETLHLELECAARNSEVKLAFIEGRLEERHRLIKNPINEAPVKDGAAMLITNQAKSKLVRVRKAPEVPTGTDVTALIANGAQGHAPTQGAIKPIH